MIPFSNKNWTSLDNTVERLIPPIIGVLAAAGVAWSVAWGTTTETAARYAEDEKSMEIDGYEVTAETSLLRKKLTIEDPETCAKVRAKDWNGDLVFDEILKSDIPEGRDLESYANFTVIDYLYPYVMVNGE